MFSISSGGVADGQQPDERAAATAFADAALDFTRDARRGSVEARRRIDAVDLPRCARAYSDAIVGTGPLEGVALGPRREERLNDVLFAAALTPTFQPLVGPMERLVARLEAIPTDDPALRSARAGWRATAWSYRMVARAPDDVCARLEEWVRAGARGLPLPAVDLRGFAAALEIDEDAKLRAGARRVRELGEGPRRAERVSGRWALEPYMALLARLEKALGVS